MGGAIIISPSHAAIEEMEQFSNLSSAEVIPIHNHGMYPFLGVAICSASTAPFEPLSRNGIKLCKETIKTMMALKKGCDSGREIGGFFPLFWDNLQRLDNNNEIYFRFDSEESCFASAKIPPRNVILIRLIKYLTSCSPEHFEWRSKELGIKHAQIGIMESHFHIFAESLLQTIATALGHEANNVVIGNWVQLLMTTVYYMTRGSQEYKSHITEPTCQKNLLN